MVLLFVKVIIFRFRSKTMDYSKAFRQDFSCYHSGTHNFSLEGTMKLKLAPFCSS